MEGRSCNKIVCPFQRPRRRGGLVDPGRRNPQRQIEMDEGKP